MVGGMLGGLLFFIFMLGPLTGVVVRPPGVTVGAAAGATLRGAYVRPLVVLAVAIGAAVWGFPVLARRMGEAKLRGATIESLREVRVRRARARRIGWWMLGGMFSLYTIVGLISGPAAVMLISKGAACIGGGAVGWALRARRGRRLVCAACDYPMGRWKGAAPACPECGAEWRRDGRHAVGVRAVAWGWLAGGAGLIGLSCVMLVILFEVMARRAGV